MSGYQIHDEIIPIDSLVSYTPVMFRIRAVESGNVRCEIPGTQIVQLLGIIIEPVMIRPQRSNKRLSSRSRAGSRRRWFGQESCSFKRAIAADTLLTRTSEIQLHEVQTAYSFTVGSSKAGPLHFGQHAIHSLPVRLLR